MHTSQNVTFLIVSHLPSMHESKGATSEPKLFRKNTLLRNRGTRQTVRLFQEHGAGKVPFKKKIRNQMHVHNITQYNGDN